MDRTYLRRCSRLLLPLLVFLLLLACALPAAADSEVRVYVNDYQISFDTPPIIIEGTTLVPMRAIFEAIGAEVYWDNENRVASGYKDGNLVEVPIGSWYGYRNGTPIRLLQPARIMNSRTLVPLRFISESLDCLVIWDGYYRTIDIYTADYDEPIPEPTPTPTPTPAPSPSSSFVTEVVRLVNVERAAYGLSPLQEDTRLDQAAAVRAKEIISKFSHYRPDGTECFTVLKEFNISCNRAAENIALGQQTPAEVVEDWMNSPGHRANILDGNFHKIGVAYASGGYGYGWVQLFTN